MKRRYEVARLDDCGGSLGVTVIVHEVGPTWKFTLRIPARLLAEHDIYDAVARMVNAHQQWEHRQRERMDDSLF